MIQYKTIHAAHVIAADQRHHVGVAAILLIPSKRVGHEARDQENDREGECPPEPLTVSRDVAVAAEDAA